MEILFENTKDVQKYAPWLYATTEFNNLKLDIELATEEICHLIGEKVYRRALNAYKSDASELDKQLVQHIQLPIALLAYRSYAENLDISHEDTGRKVKIDKDSETMPWEWMIVRDDTAILKKANKTTDRLIDFLDKNIIEIQEWAESEYRKDMCSLFVRSAKQFDEIVPIDSSRQFFIRVLPFVRQEDRDLIEYIGHSRFIEVKTALQAATETEEQQNIIRLCREIVPHRVMAKAIRRLAVSVLPDSVAMRFISESQTMKASTPATPEMIASLENIYNSDAEKATIRLQHYIQQLNPSAFYIAKEVDYVKEKFCSV